MLTGPDAEEMYLLPPTTLRGKGVDPAGRCQSDNRLYLYHYPFHVSNKENILCIRTSIKFVNYVT